MNIGWNDNERQTQWQQTSNEMELLLNKTKLSSDGTKLPLNESSLNVNSDISRTLTMMSTRCEQ
jgi:hypothetical protein